MGAYIKSITLPKSGQSGVLYTAYPVTENGGVINVICGPNNCGKTYLLRRLRFCLANFNNLGDDSSPDVRIEMTNSVDKPLKVLYFGKSWQDKERVGIIPIEKTALKLPGDRPPYRHATLSFLLKHFLYHFPDCSFSEDEWLSDVELRINFLKYLDLEYTLYKCSESNQTVQRIESLLGGHLYFRKASKSSIEIAIVTPQKLAVPFPEWSDGQKAAFYLLLMLEYSKPSILLLDEIENHLHPLYMTSILHCIKESAGQSFIATHHPHVIFTELADRVFYLEVLPSQIKREDSPEKTLKYIKVDRQAAPKRRVTTLTDGFQKISATYKLFDLQDRQLLKQCSNIAKHIETEFYKALLDIFTTEVLPASKKAIPDRQTQQLAQVIRKMTGTHGKAEGVKILDLGAGLGRIAKELSKLSIWQLANSIQWVCWEPNAKLRCDLEMILRNEQISAKIIQSYDELPKSGCHIALLANVLHEVTPEEFASLIMSAFRAISGVDNSKIIILEIYPLLRAEKYAIAYPCSYLTRLLNGIGFYCRSDTFSINDAQGYCIEAKPSCNNLNENIIQYNLLQIWEDLEKEICSSYACQEEINSYVEYRRMILELTTLASIAAWRKGIWKRLA